MACLGGECFGAAGQGFLRFSCAEPDERLVQAVAFLADAVTRTDRVKAYLDATPEVSASLTPVARIRRDAMNPDVPTTADEVVYPDSGRAADGRQHAPVGLQSHSTCSRPSAVRRCRGRRPFWPSRARPGSSRALRNGANTAVRLAEYLRRVRGQIGCDAVGAGEGFGEEDRGVDPLVGSAQLKRRKPRPASPNTRRPGRRRRTRRRPLRAGTGPGRAR